MPTDRKKVNPSTRFKNQRSKICLDSHKFHESSPPNCLTHRDSKFVKQQELTTEDSIADNLPCHHAWTTFLPNPQTGAWNQTPLEYPPKSITRKSRKSTPPSTPHSSSHHASPKIPRYSQRTRKPRFGPGSSEVKVVDKEPISRLPNPAYYTPSSTLPSKRCLSATATPTAAVADGDGNSGSCKRTRTKKKKNTTTSNLRVSKAPSTAKEISHSQEQSISPKLHPTRRCSARISSFKPKPSTPPKALVDRDTKPELPKTKSNSVRPTKFIARKAILIESDTDSQESAEEYLLKSSEKTMATSTATNLSEMEIISLYEPKKLGASAASNPGLETLPPTFGLINCEGIVPGQNSSPHPLKYELVMPKLLDKLYNLDQGSWTVAEFVSCHSENYSLRFDEQTTFDMENLPYRDLCFALNIHKNIPVTPLPPKIPNQVKKKEQNATNKVKKLKFTRSLTHLNVDFWGIGGRPEASANFLGVPMAAGDEIAKLRKRNSHDSMSLLVERRFIIAVIVIRTLTGGIECLTDWVLVSLLFPRFSLNFIRGHWKQLVIRHKKAIDRLESDFQDAFVPAYESGQIPRIDYDHLQDYDWDKLIDWTMSTVDTSFSHQPVIMPNSRLELKNRYTLDIIERKDSWRDKWLETNAAIYKRLDDSCFHALTIPIRKPQRSSQIDLSRESTDLMMAKSWIRAVALLSSHDLQNNTSFMEATEKFGKKATDAAIAELIDSKIIMHRSKKRVNLSTRDYEATEMFSRSLRREVKPKCFRDASVFKRYLDSEFRSGRACVRIDYMAWEGDVMVISNLQAHGRVTLQAIGVPREKFGLTEGGYETKKIPRERLRFDMDIYPTPTYMYDDENPVLLNALHRGAPRGHQKALPVWFTISETLNRNLWKEVYSAVAQVMALHAGINIPELVRIFTPTMEEWELSLLLEWGEEIGLFRRLDTDIDGWTADEWWWAYAMVLFADDRFTVGQDVRFEPENPFTIEGRRAG